MSITQQDSDAIPADRVPPGRRHLPQTVWMSPHERAAVRRHARAQGVSVSYLLRVVLCRELGLPIPPEPRIGRPPKRTGQEVMPI